VATHLTWLLNLDAERELADPRRYRPDPGIEARIAQLTPRMERLLDERDHVLGRDAGPAARGGPVLAFCPTPSALRRIVEAGLAPPRSPPLEVLQRVNSRAFCAALGQSLPGARYVRDLPTLLSCLRGARPSDGWVLKRDFGFAGRERRRVLGPGEPDASSLGFARRSFSRGEGLQVEPWCARSDDFALHGHVLASGALLLGEPALQQCDAHGSWQHSAPLPQGALHENERAALLREGHCVGQALAQAGYFGPFGIDAFRYRAADGSSAFQPRSEINARYSMGYPRGLLEQVLSVPDYRLG
jgi:hypothetical protein